MLLIELPHIIEEVLLNRTTCYAVHKGGVMLQELIFDTLLPLSPLWSLDTPGVVCNFKLEITIASVMN